MVWEFLGVPFLKNMIKNLKLILSFLFLFWSLMAKTQDLIEIKNADVMNYDESLGKIWRLKGNVNLLHKGIVLSSDSAWFYEEENVVKAFGNVYIRQRDTFDLWGDLLNYNGNTDLAIVSGNVRLTDGKMVLKTDKLYYDTKNKNGYYLTYGDIKDGENSLKSKKGYYYSRSKIFYFKNQVHLQNPDYEMYSDTLKYNTISDVATFFGDTKIVGEENTINCHYGWYDTENEVSRFAKGVSISGKENNLRADSMTYNRNTGFGEAFGNIFLYDSTQDLSIFGDTGYYYRLEKKTFIVGNARAIKADTASDTFYLAADTLYDHSDSANRFITAYPKAKVLNGLLAGICDSLVYQMNDSVIHFIKNPILFNDQTQTTGDTIIMFLKNQKPHRMVVYHNAFVISRDIFNNDNQIKGDSINSFFAKGKLNKVKVNGNAQSVYYILEDSSAYTGVNKIECQDMLLMMKDNKVDQVRFYQKPKGKMLPYKEAKKENLTLKGYLWQEEKRPTISSFNPNNVN